uniref:Uncharacterized protein n=1 Tax=Oncorhynchus tshawytscha TaxID=74940 RepID=A0A8C8JVE9_ONCTS
HNELSFCSIKSFFISKKSLFSWFTSKVCPNKSNNVSKIRHINRLFFDIHGEEEGSSADPESLQNELNGMKAVLSTKDSMDRLKIVEGLKEAVNRQKKDLDIVRKEIEENEMLSSQGRMMKYLENQQCETQAAKEEGQRTEESMITDMGVGQALKREVFVSNIKLHKATMELNMTKDDMKAVQNDLTNADRDYLRRKKVIIVQKTLSTLTHTNEALSRLVFESPAPVELKPPHLHQPPNSEDIALNMTFDIITPDPVYKRLSQVPSKKMHLDPAARKEVPMDTSFHNTNLFRKRTFGSMLDPKRIKLGAPICPLMKAKRGKKKGSRPAPPKSSTCPTLNSFLE